MKIVVGNKPNKLLTMGLFDHAINIIIKYRVIKNNFLHSIHPNILPFQFCFKYFHYECVYIYNIFFPSSVVFTCIIQYMRLIFNKSSFGPKIVGNTLLCDFIETWYYFVTFSCLTYDS